MIKENLLGVKMMNEENTNDTSTMSQSDNAINKIKSNGAGRSDGQGKEEQGLLPVYDERTTSTARESRTPAFAYATKEQVAQAMRDEPTFKYEIMYSHLLYNFEQEQIKRGLRNKINKTFERPRQITVNKPSHKNFITDSDLRKIKPIPKKKYDAILKHMKSYKRYTTTMIALSSSIGVSDVAWTLNVMYRQKLVDRAYEKTTPIIGNAGAKSLRYVYFKLK
jgi:hypothetical protein